jgi:hypothetical protein
VVHTLLDAGVERGPVDVDADLDGARVGVLQRREAGGVGPAGERDDLERPDGAAAVLRDDLRRCLRVEVRQPVVEPVRSELGELVLQGRPHPRVGAGELEAVDDRAGVERGATDEHRRSPP